MDGRVFTLVIHSGRALRICKRGMSVVEFRLAGGHSSFRLGEMLVAVRVLTVDAEGEKCCRQRSGNHSVYFQLIISMEAAIDIVSSIDVTLERINGSLQSAHLPGGPCGAPHMAFMAWLTMGNPTGDRREREREREM